MEQSFGARLRLQREHSQVSLATIAAQTKIKAALLAALERDDVSQWPTGIFRRAYLRDYARAIGLEPEAVVREFLEVYPDPVPQFAQGTETEGDGDASTRQVSGLRRLVGAMAAVPTFFQKIQQPLPAPGPATAADRAVLHAAPAPVRRIEPAVDRSPRVEPVVVAPAPMPAAPVSLAPPPQPDVDLVAVAEICTRLARLVDLSEFPPVLEAAAHVLGASGIIVRAWDPQANALAPALAHGYSDAVLSRVPPVPFDAANAVAAAFRAGDACVVNGDERCAGAMVAPLLTPSGCTGVLAVELRDGGEQRDTIRAVTTILAAQLATLLGPISTARTPEREPQAVAGAAPAGEARDEDGPYIHHQADIFQSAPTEPDAPPEGLATTA
jgi:hypothetical protein